MSDAISRSEAGTAAGPAATLAALRARGGIAARFERRGRSTRIAGLAERGGWRLALPSTFAPHAEALLVNTGGGIVGGDAITTEVSVGAGADVVIASSSAERIYRSDGAVTALDIRLTVEGDGRLDWLPQQTIVYAGARIRRRIEVATTARGRLLMAEVLTFGRPASAEAAAPVRVGDHWRVRRDGRLVFAEALALDGEAAALLGRPAVGGGARAAALVLCVAPDAGSGLERLRQALASVPCESGASAWNGLLTARALSPEPHLLLRAVARAIEALSGRALPRIWSI